MILTQHFAALPPIYRFEGVGAPEGEHAYFRGIHLGPEHTYRREMHNDGTLNYTDHPVDHSTDPHEVLGRLQEHTQRLRDRGDIADADHPLSAPFGAHWTTDPGLAHQFAFDPQHGMYRTPRYTEQAPHLGAIVEVHSTQEPQGGQSDYEHQVKAPLKPSITRAFLHVHRYDPHAAHQVQDGRKYPLGIARQNTHVSTTEIPLGVVKQAYHPESAFAFPHDTPEHQKVYLRFGDWPEDERSHNHAMGWKEDGVSVYDLGKNGHPLDPDPHMERGHEHEEHCEPDCDLDSMNSEYGNDTREEMEGRVYQSRRHNNTGRSDTAHLVTGTHAGVGHDGETLLHNVKTVGHWPCDVHKHIPGLEPQRPDWCEHPDHDDEDEHHTASISDIQDLLGRPTPKNPAAHADEPDEAERMQKIHNDWQDHIHQHREWQDKRPGLNPGDHIGESQMGKDYPTAEWVPIHVAQRFRDHTGDQHEGSTKIVDDLTEQFKSGRGVTDPLMLLHHNEARVAHLGEGNHRLKAMENAGWSHVPMRVCRMYDGESKDYLHQPDKHIPTEWMGSHVGRTPDIARPSEVFNFGSTAYPGEHDEEAGQGGDRGHQSFGRRRGPLALLRWVAAGKSRRRDQRQRGQQGAPGPEQPDAPVVGQPKPVSWHPKAVKDLKALGKPEQSQILSRIEDLRVDDPIALGQTHALYGDLKGWAATKASRGHRIIHKTNDDGSLFIGHVGLHEYGDANRRLKGQGSKEQPNLWPPHPLFRPGDRVMRGAHAGTVHHVDESDDPDHHGTVWVQEDRDKNEERPMLSGTTPSLTGSDRISIHPDAPPEQHEHYRQQKAKNDAGEPYVPQDERNIDESDRITVHHLTHDRNFKPDPTRRVQNNTTLGGDLSPRLFVGNPNAWENTHSYRRPYVAEMSVPKAVVKGHGYLGEGQIPARHFDKVHVKRVVPADAFEAEQYEGKPFKGDARDWTPEQHAEHLRKHRERLHEQHGWGWNEFNDKHEWTGIDDDSEDEDGYPIRRDRQGKPMTQHRSVLGSLVHVED